MSSVTLNAWPCPSYHCCIEMEPHPAVSTGSGVDVQVTVKALRLSLSLALSSLMPASALICPCRMLLDLLLYRGKREEARRSVVMDLSLPGDRTVDAV